jgi:outer membrane protein OmpA-like peptidoglycan-associated protein
MVNPYLPLADIFINFTLILVLFGVAMALTYSKTRANFEKAKEKYPDLAALDSVGGAGGAEGTGVEAFIQQQAELEQKIHGILGEEIEFQDRLDPAGVKRFEIGHQYFDGTALTPQGRDVVRRIGQLLAAQDAQKLYRRIRIEGHSMPPPPTGTDDEWRWEFSLRLAKAVASVFRNEVGIPPHFFIISGRGGQSPKDKYDPRTGEPNPRYDYTDPKHLRVEIVIEFAEKNALGEKTKQD